MSALVRVLPRMTRCHRCCYSQCRDSLAQWRNGELAAAGCDKEMAMVTRRGFVQGAGGFAGMLTAGKAAHGERADAGQRNPAQRPNLLVLMTDQERYHTHWPPGW